ncbi:MAG: hypothetical protein KBE09_01740 [Candidatus Pacebacteria bacterium]|nr:hypothetical protein [Candidatus Paceibacterota bacterium]
MTMMSVRDFFLFVGIHAVILVGFYWISGIVVQRNLEAAFAEGRAQYIAEQKNPTPVRPRPAIASLVKQ